MGERFLQAGRWTVRRATQQWRSLPDFVIIGAPRAGTTSLYQALCSHPDIGRSFRKEVHFFDGRVERGLGWYRANFPLRIASTRICGEATPNYLANPDAPDDMARLLPDVRLIALLRNPIDRTHSSWRLKVLQGDEMRSFGDAIRQEAEDPYSQAVRTRDPRSGPGPRGQRFAHLEKGRYAEHIERWFTRFPREQLLIVQSEDLFRRPAETQAAILQHIGADPAKGAAVDHLLATPPADMEPADREWLREYFAPHIGKLEDVTGMTFDWQ